MVKISVLFVCVHNSARSQMAEAFLKAAAGDRFEAESAGLEPGALNPVVVAALKEVGIDISGNKTKGVGDFLKQGRRFDYVIAVCDGANASRCPVFPGASEQLYWSFEDPSTFAGTFEERLARVRLVRDAIRAKVEAWVKAPGPARGV